MTTDDRYEKYKDILERYLARHNPRVVPQVPRLLLEYHGREGALFAKLERKYKIPVLKSTVSTKALDPSYSGQHKNIYDKLLDPKLFTGHHKHRFCPKTGKGLGLDGRDYVMKGHGTYGVTRFNDHGYNGDTNTGTDTRFTCISQFMVRQEEPRPFRPPAPTNVLPRATRGGPTPSHTEAPPRPAPPSKRPKSARPASAGVARRANGYPMRASNDQAPKIFSKLCDPKMYTGAHKHRFDEFGKGKGLDGRDLVCKTGNFGPMNSDRHGYYGDTNTKTDVTFHCISQFLDRSKPDRPWKAEVTKPARPKSARGPRPPPSRRPQSARPWRPAPEAAMN